MTAVYDVTNQLQQTIAAMRDHSDNNSQSYPYQRPPQQQSHPNQWQPQQNQKHFSRQEHFNATRPGAHQTSRVCRNCGGKSCFSKFSCPARGKFCQKCKRYNHFEHICIDHFLQNNGNSQKELAPFLGVKPKDRQMVTSKSSKLKCSISIIQFGYYSQTKQSRNCNKRLRDKCIIRYKGKPYSLLVPLEFTKLDPIYTTGAHLI